MVLQFLVFAVEHNNIVLLGMKYKLAPELLFIYCKLAQSASKCFLFENNTCTFSSNRLVLKETKI